MKIKDLVIELTCFEALAHIYMKIVDLNTFNGIYLLCGQEPELQ